MDIYPVFLLGIYSPGNGMVFQYRYTLHIKHHTVCAPDMSRYFVSKWLTTNTHSLPIREISWWRHVETFSALLALCVGNSPVTGEFPSQRPVTQSFGVLFDLSLNKRLGKQSWGWWPEMPSRSLWRHCNAGCRFWIPSVTEDLLYTVRNIAFYWSQNHSWPKGTCCSLLLI